MTGPASPSAPARWRELLALVEAEAGERSFLLRLLEHLNQSCGLSGSALYLESGSVHERRLVVGSGEFPRTLGEPGAEEPADLRMAGALLRFAPASPGVEVLDGPMAVALSAAVRAYTLRQSLERQKFEVNYRGVGLEALYDVGLAIAGTLNLEELSEEILVRAVSLLDARRGALYLIDGDAYRLDKTFGGDARREVARDDPMIDSALGARERPDQDLLPGARYLMAAPVGSDLQARGLLVVGDKESRRGIGPFQSTDRRTLSLFANQAAIALETAHLHRQALEKERLEREMELAADIQRRLLPASFPAIEGLEIAGWSRPARHVGGDYYDLLRLPDGKLAGVIADVSGKGMPAALMVSTVHSAVRLLLDRSEIGPALLDRLNRLVLDSSAPNKFITLLLLEFDPVAGSLRYLSAGHNPALVLSAGGEIGAMAVGGLPLGIFSGGAYRVETRAFASGDLLCAYSDGITECVSPEDEEFGPERLAGLLRKHRRRPLAELVEAIDRAMVQFARGRPQADDQTVLLVRRA